VTLVFLHLWGTSDFAKNFTGTKAYECRKIGSTLGTVSSLAKERYLFIGRDTEL
jgi:hypothetical protein